MRRSNKHLSRPGDANGPILFSDLSAAFRIIIYSAAGATFRDCKGSESEDEGALGCYIRAN